MEKIYTLRVKREEANLLKKLLINNKEYMLSERDSTSEGITVFNCLEEYVMSDCLLNEIDAMCR